MPSTKIPDAEAARRVRVVHVDTVHPAWDVRIFEKECVSLAGAGYDVHLVIPAERSETIRGVNVVALPRVRRRVWRLMYLVWYAFWVALRLRGRIYHLHSPEMLPPGQLLRLFGKSVVFDMHENLPKSILDKRYLPRILRRPLSACMRAAERFLLLGIPVVFAENSYVKDYRYVRRGTVVLNMPMINRLEVIRETKHAQPTVGYVGAVSAARGSRVTLEALEVLRDQGFDVAWHCVGAVNADEEAGLRRAIEEKGLDVCLTGPLPSAEAWSSIARCHVGLAVLEPTPNFVDSYPTKIFEYMALGLPVVASDFPLYRDVVKGNGCGINVDPRDARQVAAAIRTILETPGLAREMGEAGHRAVREKFNWEHEFAKLHRLYAGLVGKRCESG